MSFRGRLCRTAAISCSQASPLQLTSSTLCCTVCLALQHRSVLTPTSLAVRCHPRGGPVAAAVPERVPFAVFSRDHSVILETINRGDLDSDADGKRTIVLCLYEAYGGHASISLQVNVPGVVATYSTNLLEDDDCVEALALEPLSTGEAAQKPPLSGGLVILLAFRGFEVKTVKLVLAKEGISSRDGTFFNKSTGTLPGYAKGVLIANTVWTA